MKVLQQYEAYHLLAKEYYDSKLHPTSANFRAASASVLAEWIPMGTPLRILDAGAGRSLVGELLLERGSNLHGLVALDASSQMLDHSNEFCEWGAALVLGDCLHMPLRSDTFDIVVSALGDTYNSGRFWHQVQRVLKEGGVAIFTTPSYAWASAFRTASQMDSAAFVLENGIQLEVPSNIHPIAEQRELIESAGLRVKEVIDVPMVAGGRPVSPKLLPSRGLGAAIVTTYVVMKV